MTIEEAYQILGLHLGASHEEVKSAYRKRARETHPDAGGKAQEFIRVQAAYEILCNYQGQPRESYDIPIPSELRWVIDQLVKEYQSEMARQQATCRAYMNDLQKRLTRQVSKMPRNKLAKFNNLFRREWNSTIRAVCRSVNGSCNQAKEKYENWFDDSMGDLHEQIQSDRFSQYIRSPKFYLQGALPLVLCIILAIVLHNSSSGLALLAGLVISLIVTGALVLNSFMQRYRKPRKVEVLDIAPFKAGRNDIVSYSSEVIRSDIRTGRVAGAGGFILGDIVTRGIAGPVLGGLIGWGAVTVISHIVNPTPKIKAGIITELNSFILLTTPELERYIMQAQQGVYADLRDTILRNYKSRVQKMTKMLADTASMRAIES